jgi:hypothetical protein
MTGKPFTLSQPGRPTIRGGREHWSLLVALSLDDDDLSIEVGQ